MPSPNAPTVRLAVLLFLLSGLAAACGGGPQGLLQTQHVAPAKSATAQRIVHTALGLRGTPYRWGGCDPKHGFDCSGYVWWVYGQNGLRLPRTTKQQITAGHGVDPKYLNPADLIFFQFRQGLHVGIHLGGGDFAHSPKTGGAVRVDNLNSGYWAARLIAARRVLE